MKKNFFEVFDDSLQTIFYKKDKGNIFILPLIMLVIANQLMNPTREQSLMDLFGIFLMFWGMCILIFDVVDLKIHNKTSGIKERLLGGIWSTPTFFLYTLLFCILLAIGLTFILIPGIYVCWAFMYAPILAIIATPDEGHHFSRSRELTKKHGMFCFQVMLCVLMAELLPFLFKNFVIEITARKIGGLEFLLTIAESMINLWGGILLVLSLLKIKS